MPSGLPAVLSCMVLLDATHPCTAAPPMQQGPFMRGGRGIVVRVPRMLALCPGSKAVCLGACLRQAAHDDKEVPAAKPHLCIVQQLPDSRPCAAAGPHSICQAHYQESCMCAGAGRGRGTAQQLKTPEWQRSVTTFPTMAPSLRAQDDDKMTTTTPCPRHRYSDSQRMVCQPCCGCSHGSCVATVQHDDLQQAAWLTPMHL